METMNRLWHVQGAKKGSRFATTVSLIACPEGGSYRYPVRSPGSPTVALLANAGTPLRP